MRFSLRAFAAVCAIAIVAVLALPSSALAATAPKISGKYTGTVKIPGVHNQGVRVTIGKVHANGGFTGSMVATANPSIKIAVTGTRTSATRFTITLAGTHSGGAIDATGTGRIAKSGKRLTLTLTFTQGGQAFPGTLVLKRK
jgi:hypothetical protein